MFEEQTEKGKKKKFLQKIDRPLFVDGSLNNKITTSDVAKFAGKILPVCLSGLP